MTVSHKRIQSVDANEAGKVAHAFVCVIAILVSNSWRACLREIDKGSSMTVEFSPVCVAEHHGYRCLPFWNGPIFSEKTVLLLAGNELKAVLFVKADGPLRVHPGSDQHRTGRQGSQMG